MSYSDQMMSGWMGVWMWIPMILSVALLVLGMIAVARALSTRTPRESNEPLTIAARRFARGEISKDEYETIRATLSG